MAASEENMDQLKSSDGRTSIHYRQAISPQNLTVSRSDQDQNTHDFFGLDGRGKGRLTVAVNNQTNAVVVVTVYGAHAVDSVVGDEDVFQIGQFSVAGDAQGYETINDPFPWYIIRTQFVAAAPSDASALPWVTYANFSAF